MPSDWKAGSTVSGPSNKAGLVADPDPGHAVRPHEHRADPRDEGQIEAGRDALAQAEGGAGEAAGAEGALVQPVDGGRVLGPLGVEVDRDVWHGERSVRNGGARRRAGQAVGAKRCEAGPRRRWRRTDDVMTGRLARGGPAAKRFGAHQ